MTSTTRHVDGGGGNPRVHGGTTGKTRLENKITGSTTNKHQNL